MTDTSAGKVISTILKHDRKVTSYKLALLRAINDVVLSFPDLESFRQDVAVPLRVLAEYWVAYYWPFVDLANPILQGPRSTRASGLSQDMDFRPALTNLRLEWEKTLGTTTLPSDGFILMNEMRVPRKRNLFPPTLTEAYGKTIKTISNTLENPICYAGPSGEKWTVFDRPALFSALSGQPVPVPGTRTQDKCLVIKADLWQTFREMSLWVEALCLHEWCLFSERVPQESGQYLDRGQVYRLLTDRPDNRRPLTWERNNIDLLILEGKEFICPWTEKRLHRGVAYDLDHLVPVSVYPINEMWNLVPADPYFNSHVKRDRLPSIDRLARAKPHLALAYTLYTSSSELRKAIREDATVRFSSLQKNEGAFSEALAVAATGFIGRIAEARNLARFD